MGESDTDAHAHALALRYGVVHSDASSDADGDCHRTAFCIPHADCRGYLRLPDACRQRNTFAFA
jgi:hypothetical protein